jgi:Tfp pilus assembly protein PilV
MTLIEVLVAIVLLTGVLLGMGTYVARFVRGTADSANISTASDLVTDRLEQIKGFRTYSTLESTFIATENPVTGYPSFRRETRITRTNNATRDYKTVTVIVTSALLASPVQKSTIIAAF